MFSSFHVPGDPLRYKNQIFSFISAFEDAVMLDSNNVQAPFTGMNYHFLAAAGIFSKLPPGPQQLDDVQQFISSHQQYRNWIFGFLAYDVKNEIENLKSGNPDFTSFPLMHFFVPQHIFVAVPGGLNILSVDRAEEVWKLVIDQQPDEDPLPPEVYVSHMPGRDQYHGHFADLLKHIQLGDIYEVNYCHEVRAVARQLDTRQVFRKLTGLSPNPFSCYYKTQGNYLMCSSPERFITKKGNTLISQPVKGTAPRHPDHTTDQRNKEDLAISEKERSENIMITDLVRNDLSKVAVKSSVTVNELCKVYSFTRAHQMISTISCETDPDTSFTEIIKAMFPMGSMTGAPKISAMQLIEDNEDFRRSLFSGTVGYIDPDGDFDFNVIIRCILYNEQTGKLSIQAGSALTALSDPDMEYDETLVKLAPQLEAVGIKSPEKVNEGADEKSS